MIYMIFLFVGAVVMLTTKKILKVKTRGWRYNVIDMLHVVWGAILGIALNRLIG